MIEAIRLDAALSRRIAPEWRRQPPVDARRVGSRLVLRGLRAHQPRMTLGPIDSLRRCLAYQGASCPRSPLNFPPLTISQLRRVEPFPSNKASARPSSGFLNLGFEVRFANSNPEEVARGFCPGHPRGALMGKAPVLPLESLLFAMIGVALNL
jgi:hypothetical protein